jgi:NADH:ubiquinone oxidoreductase subunit F (NADH-binding)
VVPAEDGLIDAADAAGLLGRGGACFPMAIKLRSVRDRPAPRFIVANGEEGEPLSVKDRWLLRIRPHLVLDGVFRAARSVKAERAFIYVSDSAAALSVHEALGELGMTPVPVTVVEVTPAYVAGEETAVVRAINGGPALPVDKPPRPFEVGVGGQPTLVSNVETLANLPSIELPASCNGGSGGKSVRSADTFLVTLSGARQEPGLYEVATDSSLAEVIEAVGGGTGHIQGALMGGYFGGLIGSRVLDLPLSHMRMRDEGARLGCGAIWLIDKDQCPVQLAADVMRYFESNNARQCGPCIRGTSSMSAALDRLAGGDAADADLEHLARWSISLLGRGACAYLDGAAALPSSLFREFRAHVEQHRTRACPGFEPLISDRLSRLRVRVSS